MKKIIFSISTLLFIVVAMTACEKNEQKLIAYSTSADAALTKVVHAMPYMRGPIQLKVNGTRVSNNLTYSTPFPGGGLNTAGSSNPDYLALTGGNATVSFSIPNVGTNNDSIALFSGSVAIENRKYQTVFATDTAANTQLVVVQDDIAMPDSGFSRFRFIHLMPNVPAVDLYFGATVVASNIAYKQVSPSFVLPTPITAAWAIRPAGAAGSTTALATYTTSSVGNQRVVTVFSRGYNGLASPDVRRPMISLLFNR